MTSLDKPQIDPKSLRGRLAVLINGIIQAARLDHELMNREAKEQGLTPDQLLAVVLTEAILKLLPGGE